MVEIKGQLTKFDQKGSGPGARSSHAIAIVGKKVYTFGGEFSPRVPVDNKLYVFDLEDQSWSVTKASGDVPPPRVGGEMGPAHRSYHSTTSDERYVYIFGGCGFSGRLSDLWAYDVVDQKWIQYLSPGENCKGRGGPGLAVINGKVWVVYGFAGQEADDVHCFDLVKKEWPR